MLKAPHAQSSVKKIIGVVSGKGGVGKSLTTSLLASYANKQGKSVGIMDADITGPSIPHMFGVTERMTGDENGINTWYPLGNPEEYLLKNTLSLITTGTLSDESTTDNGESKTIRSSIGYKGIRIQ